MHKNKIKKVKRKREKRKKFVGDTPKVNSLNTSPLGKVHSTMFQLYKGKHPFKFRGARTPYLNATSCPTR